MLCGWCGGNESGGSCLCSECEHLEQAFFHESGHVLMHIVQEIPFHGIYFEKHEGDGRLCTPAPPKPPEERSKRDYLVLAAGVAAEKVIYGMNHESQGAGADRQEFESPNAPAFGKTVAEAYEILSSRELTLRRLVSELEAKAKAVGFNLFDLSDRGMDGSDRRYGELLNREELEAAVRQS
jgi:hypothetical protein